MSSDQAAVLESVAAKLATLDLTTAEQQVLAGVLERAAAADADVEGYGVVFEVERTFNAGMPDTGKVKLARAIGLDPASVWTDMRPRT